MVLIILINVLCKSSFPVGEFNCSMKYKFITLMNINLTENI